LGLDQNLPEADGRFSSVPPEYTEKEGTFQVRGTGVMPA